MNLIEQQNILRGLADNALQGEMQSGTVPPYLVLAEINRRKTARERYEAAVAKRGGNQTVAEELLGKAAPKGIDAMMGQPQQAAPAGIDAAMPQEQPAFADGGVVGYADGGLADLVSAYNQRLSGLDKDREMAQKMALMQIGAQIMAGRSRNTLSNVGSGLAAALPGYQQSMERLNVQEMQGLRDQIDLARQMEQDRLNAEDRAYTRKIEEERNKYAGLPSEAADIARMDELAASDPDLYAKTVAAQAAAGSQKAQAELERGVADVIQNVNEAYKPLDPIDNGTTVDPVQFAELQAQRDRDRLNEMQRQVALVYGEDGLKILRARLMQSAMNNQSPVMASSGSTGSGQTVIDYTDLF